MPDVSTAIGLVVAGILGGVGTWWSRRQLRKAGIGGTSAEAIRNLQYLADSWEERASAEQGDRVKAEQALAALELIQADERRDAARDRRDLDDARAEIRALERRLRARGPR